MEDKELQVICHKTIHEENSLPNLSPEQFIHSLWKIHQNLDFLRASMSDRRLTFTQDGTGDSSQEDESALPETNIVIKFGCDVGEKTINWLIDKIRGRRNEGGVELIAMAQAKENNTGRTLHITASKIKFLEVAEELEIIKKDKNGIMREFIVGQLEEFLEDGMHVDDILTTTERQTIVRHELENIRALPEDVHIVGYPEYSLYEGQSILQVCQKWGIITKMYPLHDQEALKKLGKSWYLTLSDKQPFEDIRNYFGESIALYFTFLDFYTRSLVVPVALGLLQTLHSRETMPFFCIFNVVWVVLVLEVWKRKSSELAFKWGTIGMTSLDEPRPNFKGKMGIDAVTGKVQPQSPRYFTTVKMYCVSIPIVFICMCAAFYIMLVSFWAEDYLKQSGESYKQFIMIPSIIYSIVVFIMNLYYRKLATYLTEWENHRTQSQYDRHRVSKLVLFEFVNNFMALFYIAFITRDMDNLRSQLQTMLIISQGINNFQEAGLPLALKYYSTKFGLWKMLEKKELKYKIIRPENREFSLPQIPEDDSRIKQAEEEGEMDDYEGTYDDYLELFIQFGYVFLFSSVYPLAALWAMINNVLEIRADAFKLCKIYQRPMNRRVKDIGAWQRAFEVMGALSILTNCGLLYLSPQIRSQFSTYNDIEFLLLFVFLEHCLLGIRYLIHISISDKPEWVRVALAKKNYESKQALKAERSKRKSTIPTRRFKTVHGIHALKRE